MHYHSEGLIRGISAKAQAFREMLDRYGMSVGAIVAAARQAVAIKKG